jgi:hypothetical protein
MAEVLEIVPQNRGNQSSTVSGTVPRVHGSLAEWKNAPKIYEGAVELESPSQSCLTDSANVIAVKAVGWSINCQVCKKARHLHSKQRANLGKLGGKNVGGSSQGLTRYRPECGCA